MTAHFGVVGNQPLPCSFVSLVLVSVALLSVENRLIQRFPDITLSDENTW